MYAQTLVSCNWPNTSGSVIETDEGVGTEDLSQLIGSSSQQDHVVHIVADDSTQLDVSSIHHELLRKNEQLKFLREMLKEVCIT